ncbi:MAG: hypothetical protein A3K06_01780 [Candidatus Doudnabacteria bacterium RIFCSPHIGHO2_01_52_17]|uniref:Uncharacterized protein n=1 Tax=Candidatus Doudnabacteria bacterium RIFCSPHIGHO2_01_52_17 TaxID=1817820 RepID=A0A1F5N8X4_9BACT|nr:MAG: hypothetical protein A3K06_01780 [Candidatus Doudnabacteria bacterium RIFCSPHIGHO2_01_52_17]
MRKFVNFVWALAFTWTLPLAVFAVFAFGTQGLQVGDWGNIGLVMFQAMAVGFAIDMVRHFPMIAELFYFFKASTFLVPGYVLFELGLRRTWPEGEGQSLLLLAGAGLATGLVFDALRYYFRRRRKRFITNQSSDI